MFNVKTSRQLQADQTRNHILDTASHLVEEKPVSEIRIKDITSASGVSTGTFYHYFSSKEELFSQIALEPTTNELLDIAEASHKPLMERLEAYCYLRANNAQQQGLPMTRNLQQFRMTELYRQTRLQMFGTSHFEHDILCKIFQDAVDSGELNRSFPIQLNADIILYTLYGLIFNSSLYDEPFLPSNWIPQFVDYLKNIALAPYWGNKNNNDAL